MAKGNIRKQKGNARGVRIVLIVTLILCVFLVAAIIETRKETDRVLQDESAWQASLDAEESYSDELADSGGTLSIEKIIEIARERFGLLFKNEIIVQPEEQ